VTQAAIYGAGGFGREVAWLAEACSARTGPVEPVCLIDDDVARQGRIINGLPVMSLMQAQDTFPRCLVSVAISRPAAREKAVAAAAAVGFEFATLIHPATECSRWVEYGTGTIICAGAILTVNIAIGRHVHINLACTVGHDVVLGDFSTLTPGVHVSGSVHVGKRVYIGTGAVIINGTEDAPLTIGDDAVIGAGAVVTRSVPAGLTVVGVPARPLGKG
jgi:sugar O-acyltransferase (sialic acid O-acetyltransferase NeuD family)